MSLENIVLRTKSSTLYDSMYTVCLEDLWRYKMDSWLPRALCGFGGNDLSFWDAKHVLKLSVIVDAQVCCYKLWNCLA